AAAGAGIPVVITRSTYFSDDDFTEALLVVDDLSDIDA
ncbi:HAD family hydrolase, partial [Bradyrhizobium sp. Cham227]|nr:HAD family hydrolase [Bradyrhizobium brasilense]